LCHAERRESDCFDFDFAYEGLLLGSRHLWGPVAALLVLVVLGSFIPLAEIGGRAVDDLRRLSWFGLCVALKNCKVNVDIDYFSFYVHVLHTTH